MSVDIFFEKDFTLREVKEKTDLKIELLNDSYWIGKDTIGMEASCVKINDSVDDMDQFVTELTSHGCPEASDIIEEIVLKLQTLFATDSQMEEIWRMENPTVEDFDRVYEESSDIFGYIVDDQGKIIKK